MFVACDDGLGDAGATDRPVVTMDSKGKIYPNRKQAAIMARIAGQTRWLWNHWLAESVETYRREGRFIFYREMNAALPGMRASEPRLADSLHRPLQMTLMSLDRALRDCAKTRGVARPSVSRKILSGEVE